MRDSRDSKRHSIRWLASAVVVVLIGCRVGPETPPEGGAQPTPARRADAPAAIVPETTSAAHGTPAPVSAPTPSPTPSPIPERRVTLTTTTTLRDLAAELSRQLGIEYLASDEVAQTTLTVEFRNATRGEVEDTVKNKAGVQLIYSDREIPNPWVHFVAP